MTGERVEGGGQIQPEVVKRINVSPEKKEQKGKTEDKEVGIV